MDKIGVFINLMLTLVLFAIINYKLLSLIKYENRISKLSDGARAALSVLFLGVGYYLIMTRFNISSEIGIPVSITLFFSMLFIALGTKTYKRKPKKQ